MSKSGRRFSSKLDSKTTKLYLLLAPIQSSRSIHECLVGTKASHQRNKTVKVLMLIIIIIITLLLNFKCLNYSKIISGNTFVPPS